MDELLALYPQNVTQDDTGTQNVLTPESKRIASILGDVVFQATRRFFVQTVSDKQNTWWFCTLHAFFSPMRAPVLVPRLLYAVYSHAVSKRLKSLPVLGSFHQSDLPNIYGGGDLTDF
jgi:acetylcholinesterase